MFWRLVLTVMLVALPATAQAAWSRVDSDNFMVYGDVEGDRLVRFAEKVEKFDALLRKFSGLAPDVVSPNRLTIFVMSGADAVQRTLGPKAANIAGFYVGNISGSFAVVPRSIGSGRAFDIDADAVLFHEYAHHFMLQYFPAGYPSWYIEGFAEFWSTAEFKNDGAIAVGLPARFRYWALALSKPFKLTRMFAADIGTLNVEERGSFYAWSWLLTHYLTIVPGRRGQLTTYLSAFAKGEPPETAARAAFGDIDALQKELDRYADATKITYMGIKKMELPVAKTRIVPLDAAQRAMMPLFIQFTRGSRTKAEVADFVKNARQMAARYPAHPMALELLAEGELDAAQLDAAAKANDALIIARPTDACALLRRARIAEARLGKSIDPEAWKAVRQLVVKANRAAPDDPFPLAQYYRTFVNARAEPPQIATDGLVRALELAPQAAQLRFMLASQLMKQGKQVAAANVLAPMLNEPHSPRARAVARRILDGLPPPVEPDLGNDEDSGKTGK
jgi:hypothetical protein